MKFNAPISSLSYFVSSRLFTIEWPFGRPQFTQLTKGQLVGTEEEEKCDCTWLVGRHTPSPDINWIGLLATKCAIKIRKIAKHTRMMSK